MRTYLPATTGVAALLAAMPAHVQTMTGAVAKRRLRATGHSRARHARTPRMGVLVAASLFFATAGPALAQITLNTTSAATVTAVASTSAALQTAIETYAANPTAAM